MTNQQADLNGRSHSGRRDVSLRILIDHASFPAKSLGYAGETIPMDGVDSRREFKFAGVAARTVSACRIVCSIDWLLSALMAVLAALVLNRTRFLGHSVGLRGHGHVRKLVLAA